MGFFSGIKKVVGAVSSIAGAVSGNPLIQVGSSILGSVLTNNANSAEASANRQFQADQTGTAYQRAVTDLKAAGLNPMLAYTNGGASSGGGAQAVMQNAIGSGASTAMQAARLKQELKNMRETEDNTRANTAKAKVDTKNSQDLTASNLALNNLLGAKAAADTSAARAAAAKSLADAGTSNALTGKILQETLGAQNDAEWRKSHPRTNSISNYINALVPGASGASNAASAYRTIKTTPKPFRKR